MNTIPNNKKTSGPRTKKERTGLNKRSAEDPGPDTGMKSKQGNASEDENEVQDTDMTQYQNIDSGKGSSDTERSDNDIEGPDNSGENIFK